MNFLKTKDWAIPYSSIDNIRIYPVNEKDYIIRVRTVYGEAFTYEEFPTLKEAEEALEKLTNEIHCISIGSCPTFSTAR